MNYEKVLEESTYSYDYTPIAKTLARQLFNREFTASVYFFDDRKSYPYGFYHSQWGIDMKTKEEGYVPTGIYLNYVLYTKSKEAIIDVLKHELCHWACQQAGLEWHDGSKDFEAELLRVGASSTQMELDRKKSVAYQKEIISGERNRLGSKRFNYKAVKPELGRRYKKAYEVFYDNALIGVVEKNEWGSHKWTSKSLHNRVADFQYDEPHWETRKDVAEVLLKEYEAKHGAI